MTISECDLIRGITYKRYNLDPSKYDSNLLFIVLINRKSTRKIANEEEIVRMLEVINKKHRSVFN